MDFVLFLAGDSKQNKGLLPDVQAVVEQNERKTNKSIGPPIERVLQARRYLLHIIQLDHVRQSEQIVSGLSLTKRLKRWTSILAFVAQNDEP